MGTLTEATKPPQIQKGRKRGSHRYRICDASVTWIVFLSRSEDHRTWGTCAFKIWGRCCVLDMLQAYQHRDSAWFSPSKGTWYSLILIDISSLVGYQHVNSGSHGPACYWYAEARGKSAQFGCRRLPTFAVESASKPWLKSSCIGFHSFVFPEFQNTLEPAPKTLLS